ncbi:MAG: hypothetical protein U0821_15685 [Chloroflexota bacterium]
MATSDHAAIQRKFQQTIELHRVGVALMRQNLRRQHPEESEAQIDERLRAWMHHRPGAEHGDAAGVPGTWPRRQR